MIRNALLSIALAAGLCAGAAAAAPAPARPAAVSAAAPDAVTEYRLGSADKVKIIVYGEQTLSGEYTVSGSGLISFPLVGDITAANRTLAEVKEEIRNKLSDGYLKNPQITAEVLTFRPYYVMGEVNRPGQYPYSAGLTVLKAVATANGFTYRANKKRVFIQRNDDTQEREYKLTEETLVHPGDVIRFGERHF